MSATQNLLWPTEVHRSGFVPCAVLLCGCDDTVENRHGALDRLADRHHHLLLVLLLHHLLILVSHWHLHKTAV